MDLKILKSDVFYNEVDIIVRKYKISYIEAVTYFCEKNNVEVEIAAALIKGNPRIKSAVQIEGEDLNILPKSARLPV